VKKPSAITRHDEWLATKDEGDSPFDSGRPLRLFSFRHPPLLVVVHDPALGRCLVLAPDADTEAQQEEQNGNAAEAARKPVMGTFGFRHGVLPRNGGRHVPAAVA
jgi:hypothetical protein